MFYSDNIILRVSVCVVWCASVWKRGHVRVLLWRGTERRPCLYKHPCRPLCRSTWCLLRSRREPLGILWRRRNSHRLETRTATPRPAHHMTSDPTRSLSLTVFPLRRDPLTCRKIASLMCLKLATHTRETGTSRLVPETCTCVSQSGTSFFLVPVSGTE